MKKTIFCLLLILSFLAVSCEKIIRFKGDITESKLVLSTLLNPDTTINVLLSRSLFMLDPREPEYSFYDANTVVTATVNGGAPMELTYNRETSFYSCDYHPLSGDTIVFNASLDGYDSIRGFDVVPAKADYTISKFEISEAENSDYYSAINRYRISVNLRDSDNSTDYYKIRLFVKQTVKDTLRYFSSLSFSSNDIIFSDPDMDSLFGSDNMKSYFSDALFSGKNYDFTLITDNVYIPLEEESDETFSLFLDVQKISLEYYNYISSMDLLDNSALGGIISEKVVVYSNIENGIGIVGSAVSNYSEIPLR